MKLLTWMQRKIRQNKNEISGDGRVKNEEGKAGRERSLEGWSFDGFLTIGTLGSETYVSSSGAETPRVVISVDKIAERETEATERELRLINEELEKVLGKAAEEEEAEEEEEEEEGSRSRRSSSTTMESATCPLQGFLLGSAAPDQRKSSAKNKNRPSLAELFQRHKAEDSTHHLHKPTSINLIRKILRKKPPNAAEPPPQDNYYASDTTKFPKAQQMLHLFHKKVHPESSTHNPTHCNPRTKPAGDDAFLTLSHHSNQSLPTHNTSPPFHSIQNKELWIKTDADYLVLEL